MEYIAHHGIKGQKWGKQNGPPYPLSEAKAEQVKEVAKTEKKIKFSKEKAISAAGSAAIIAVGARTVGSIIGGPIGSAVVLGANIMALPDTAIATWNMAKVTGQTIVLKYQNYKLDKLNNKIDIEKEDKND